MTPIHHAASFLGDRNVEWALIAYYVFSAVVSSMPAPTSTAGVGYRWAYGTLHSLAGDLSHFIRAPLPAPPAESEKP